MDPYFPFEDAVREGRGGAREGLTLDAVFTRHAPDACAQERGAPAPRLTLQVDTWARSFAALGIKYRDATMTLDL